MNKMMVAVGAAVLCGSTFAEGLTSGVVGYTTGDYAKKVYNCVTFGFASVDNAEVFKMKDIKADSFSDSSDNLQLLDNETARTIKKYFAYEGKWYEDVDDWNEADDDQFDIGTGFLGYFGSEAVKLTAAGSVVEGATAMDFTGKKMVMVGNPIPRAVKFSEIEAVQFSDSSDNLQKLENTRARTVKKYFAYEGKWYEDVDDWNDASDDEFAAGEAMLGYFGSQSVQLTFPSAF